jgi:hypothetical protein
VPLAANAASPGAARGPSHGSPGCAPVAACVELESSADRIAKQTALVAIEVHAIEESFGIGVAQDQHPVAATVDRPVHAGCIAGTRAHDDRLIGAECLDITEIQRLGAGHAGNRPGPTPVHGMQHGAFAATGPGDRVTHRRQAAQAHRDRRGKRLDPARLRGMLRRARGDAGDGRRHDCRRDCHREARAGLAAHACAGLASAACLRTISIAISSDCS